LAAIAAAATLATGAARTARAADKLDTLTLDWAYYSPVSLVLKSKGWVEEEFAADGIKVRWVQSLGSNKALEFLNAGSIDLGSSAGAAAWLSKVNGNPIKTIYVYSKPEWTALVTRPDTGITKVEDLRGKRIAVTKGTDPYIFMLRALESHGLGQNDVSLVLIQHDQGKLALDRGDVDAWAGLDPMMAQAEIEGGDKLFYRDADANTYGALNVREAFLADHPDIVERVLKVYEKGRHWSLDNPAGLTQILANAAKLPEPIAARQIERTDLSDPKVGQKLRDTIIAAGEALKSAGVVKADVDVTAVTDSLLDSRFSQSLAAAQ
jgi:sulfonate transport system substrate-binding protein